jgi:hypothetical protein
MRSKDNQISGGGDPQTDQFDPLAAVVLHTLVSKGQDGMSAQRIARECERDAADPAEMREIEMALSILLTDGLAQREHDMFMPTHAATRADELSF